MYTQYISGMFFSIYIIVKLFILYTHVHYSYVFTCIIICQYDFNVIGLYYNYGADHQKIIGHYMTHIQVIKIILKLMFNGIAFIVHALKAFETFTHSILSKWDDVVTK